MSRNSVFISSGVKLLIFTIVSVLVTGLLAAIMGNIGFGAGREYRAVFTSASMLEKGDDVRIAGVSVGEVRKVEHHDRTQAMVTFRIKADVPMTTAARAEIRFLNLVGDRYLALEEGVSSEAQPLQEDDVLPVAQTSPALDLTTLFNGFKPLFQALQPEQVNELTMNLIQVLQGEGGTVRGLLQNTASLTNALADRDQLVGEVIDNLSTTLETVDGRREQLSTLVVELKDWMGDLARDRDVIGSSLGSISDLTVVLADLLRESRPVLKADIAELRKLAVLLNEKANQEQIVELLDRLPESMTDQTRTGTYGSWYNYYICGFSGKITLPELQVPGIPKGLLNQLLSGLDDIEFHSSAPRCNR
ncbi:ABC transporter substrate-binding protein [Nocardioides psychrotolerans]|uniref:Phospholipid/cholesterol/gamma-HCH transport system substrate-binding protein n=1 Tax=Nocardioides psychrotolerans TaxID=1005945 RepID=A0A1I3FW36_9ACTN|nr:MCE family protein [Nocardioides psychrotolerans]GEP37340.1 ABC transporter substrate-binding protein [Nocardioides psychrotolerans]SFI15399.1 phospholipid/cholesterol/gamma-HCH transport system substrate-binding protein [Nocardioides psychrotolerans]